MASNPNPGRISEAMWWLWTEFDKFEPSAKYGGILALKPGYHSYRSRLPKTDYSVQDLAADRVGPDDSSGIDLTLSTSAMIKYTKRLDAAARAKDKRLYIGGKPILREFIGTKDGKTVYCYVLVGGRQLGLAADAGSDPGRSETHLWHIHLSVIRQFCGHKGAMARILSILKGETYSTWAKRQGLTVTPKPAAKPAKPAAAKPTTAGLPVHKLGARAPLQAGMKGTDVQWVQRWIGVKRMGPADGIAGAKFTAGVKWYNQMRGLGTGGAVTAATWSSMGVK